MDNLLVGIGLLGFVHLVTVSGWRSGAMYCAVWATVVTTFLYVTTLQPGEAIFPHIFSYFSIIWPMTAMTFSLAYIGGGMFRMMLRILKPAGVYA